MNEYKKVYIIGIEGAGTSALAVMYKNLGLDVVGSDEGDHFYQEILHSNGIKTFEKYDKKNIKKDVDLVVYSTSIKDDNPEIEFVRQNNFKILSYPEAVAEMFNKKVGIAVCGTHGKTTTTAMLATVLNRLDYSPSAIVGSEVVEWKRSSLVGDGDYFAIEADEYQNKLAHYDPCHVILTSVDYDHPDFFKTFDDYKKAFSDFIEKIPNYGFLIYCNDSRSVVDISSDVRCRKASYGFLSDSDYRIDNVTLKESESNPDLKVQSFEVFFQEKSLGEFEIRFPGKHNVSNATAAIAMCHKLGCDLEEVKNALFGFQGTKRRFEYVGKKDKTIFIDDYAHHPEEIKTTLKAARDVFGDTKIVTIFHPHTFSRTKALLEDFSQSFDDTDELIVLDIFESREESGDVESNDLVEMVNKYTPGKAIGISTIKDVIDELRERNEESKVVISMGAGDVWRVTHELAKQ